jgi:hypothetical protein
MTDNKKLKVENPVDNGMAAHTGHADAKVAAHTMYSDVKSSILQLKDTGMKAQAVQDNAKTGAPKVVYNSKAVAHNPHKDVEVKAHTAAGHVKNGSHKAFPDTNIPAHGAGPELKEEIRRE